MLQPDSYQAFISSVCFLCLALQSWWVWSDSEITDLWYNCFHDNATDTWMCAASSENGKSLPRLGCRLYLLADSVVLHGWSHRPSVKTLPWPNLSGGSDQKSWETGQDAATVTKSNIKIKQEILQLHEINNKARFRIFICPDRRCF